MGQPGREPTSRVACGIALELVSTENGGRQMPLVGGAGPGLEWRYRPNWGLPGMTPPEQSGAMVFGFSRESILPGSGCKAVIVQLVPASVEWQRVHPGTELPCYEGARVVAHATVLWREDVEDVSDADKHRWLTWLADDTAAAP